MSADVGTRLIERQSAEYSDLYRYLYKKVRYFLHWKQVQFTLENI